MRYSLTGSRFGIGTSTAAVLIAAKQRGIVELSETLTNHDLLATANPLDLRVQFGSDRADVFTDYRSNIDDVRLLVTDDSFPSIKAANRAIKSVRNPVDYDGVVVIRHPGSALRLHDIKAALSLPIAFTVDWNSQVRRNIDAGLLPTRGESYDALVTHWVSVGA